MGTLFSYHNLIKKNISKIYFFDKRKNKYESYKNFIYLKITIASSSGKKFRVSISIIYKNYLLFFHDVKLIHATYSKILSEKSQCQKFKKK